MEGGGITTEKQGLISSFLEIAVGQSIETAVQFLQATSWRLEEAIQLFYVGNEGSGMPSLSIPLPTVAPIINSGTEKNNFVSASTSQELGDDGVRAPLPVKKDTLYGDASLFSTYDVVRSFDESRKPSVWESSRNEESSANGSNDNLASLYRPPFALIYNGPFDEAKIEAAKQARWLLINLQSTEEFNSHRLNRDTWSNEAVTQTIRSNFIFWQVNHDTTEGRKVCTYYEIYSLPAVLVVDPITGQKMHAWIGMVYPERLLEDLLPYMDRGPNEQRVAVPKKRPRWSPTPSSISISEDTNELEDEELSRAVAASLEDHEHFEQQHLLEEKSDTPKDAETSTTGRLIYPPLPEEPKGGSRELLARVGVRLPDGQRLQRNFLLSDPIKLLWSFCSTKLGEEAKTRPFRFTQAIPGASKTLEFNSEETFGESGISNSMVLLTWL